MRKVLLPILYISLIAPILFGAFDAKALDKREVSSCEFGDDANIVDLKIDIPSSDKRIKIIKAGAKLEISKYIKYKYKKISEASEVVWDPNANPPRFVTVTKDILQWTETEVVLDNATGDTTLVNIGEAKFGETSPAGLQKVWVMDRFNEICRRSSSGLQKKTIQENYEAVNCSIKKEDGIGIGGGGLNIESMGLKIGSKEVIGLPKGGIITNLRRDFPVSVRVYDANTGEYVYNNDTLSIDSNNARAIRHNADYICNTLNESGSAVSLSSPAGSPPPSSGGRGTPTIFQGGGPGTSGGVGAGGTAGTAQIQEGCNIGRKIQFKDSDTTVSFEENEFVGPGNDRNTGKWGVVCVVNTVNTVADWAFFILISVAFVFILIAGFLWMTGRGEAEKMKKAGQMIGAALVGIVIALLSRVIPGVITGILT